MLRIPTIFVELIGNLLLEQRLAAANPVACLGVSRPQPQPEMNESARFGDAVIVSLRKSVVDRVGDAFAARGEQIGESRLIEPIVPAQRQAIRGVQYREASDRR